MPQPDRAQYYDQLLTNVGIAYYQSNDSFVSTQVAPVIPVERQSAKYYVITQNDAMRDEMQLRANGDESAGSGFGLSTDSYNCDVFALHKDITEQDRANWNMAVVSIEDATTRFLVQQGLQRLERQFVTDYFTTGKWTATGSDAAPGNLWNDFTQSDPISDVQDYKTAVLKGTGFEPNTLIVGYEVWAKLRQHPSLLSRVTGGATVGNPAQMSHQTVAALLDVERLLVAKAVKATNKENETAAYDFIFGKSALLAYVPPAPTPLTPSAMYTFAWTGS